MQPPDIYVPLEHRRAEPEAEEEPPRLPEEEPTDSEAETTYFPEAVSVPGCSTWLPVPLVPPNEVSPSAARRDWLQFLASGEFLPSGEWLQYSPPRLALPLPGGGDEWEEPQRWDADRQAWTPAAQPAQTPAQRLRAQRIGDISSTLHILSRELLGELVEELVEVVDNHVLRGLLRRILRRRHWQILSQVNGATADTQGTTYWEDEHREHWSQAFTLLEGQIRDSLGPAHRHHILWDRRELALEIIIYGEEEIQRQQQQIREG
jgi:hypothetical protein